MEFVIGIFKAVNLEGDLELVGVLGHSPMTMERAEVKCDIINTQLGFKLDEFGGFVSEPGEIFAMYDHKDDIGPVGYIV